MGLRFNPPPNWPPPPPGFVPPPRWQPDPSWPPPPSGWQLWVPDDAVPVAPGDLGGGLRESADGAGDLATDPHDVTAGSSDLAAGPGEFADGSGSFSAAAGGVAAGPDELAGGPDGFAGGPGEFAGGPDGFAGGPGEFAGGPDGFAGGPGEFAGGQDDFAGGQDDFAGGEPTTIDPLGPPPGSYPGGPPGEPAGAGAADPRSGRTNGFAVAAFVLGLLGGTLLSFIFALVALGQIRRTPQRGKGLAIAGLVLSIAWGLALVLYFTVGASGTPAGQAASGGTARSPSTGSASGGSGGSGSHGRGSSGTSVFALRTGQCFQNPPASQASLGITSVTVVSCSTPHNAQVFVEFPATGKSYPGAADLKRQADVGCHARISANVASSKITNSMTLRFLYPLSESWTEGHRTITCLVVDSKPDLTSSLLRAHTKH